MGSRTLYVLNNLIKFSTYVKPTLNYANMVLPLFSETLKGVVEQNFPWAKPQPRHFSSVGSAPDLEVPFPLFLPPPLHEASSASDVDNEPQNIRHLDKKMPSIA